MKNPVTFSMQRLLASTMVLLLCSIVAKNAHCEDFQSLPARTAADEYQESLRQARKIYLKSLETASSIAAKDKDLAEVARIKNEITSISDELELNVGADELSLTRRSIQDSTYTWNRPRDPDRLFFSKNGKVTTQKNKSNGVWEVIEPDLVILKFGKNIFLLKLSSNYRSFNVIAFGPIKSSYKSGKRTN